MTGIQILVGTLGYSHNHIVMYRTNTPTQSRTVPVGFCGGQSGRWAVLFL